MATERRYYHCGRESRLCTPELANRWFWRFRREREARYPVAEHRRWLGRCLDHERVYNRCSMASRRCPARLANSGDTGCQWKRYQQHFLVKREHGPTSYLDIERINLCVWSPIRLCRSGMGCSTSSQCRERDAAISEVSQYLVGKWVSSFLSGIEIDKE
jgi:hypothetical protein